MIVNKIGDREGAIAIEIADLFQMMIGIGITIAISTFKKDRDHDLNFGDRANALENSKDKLQSPMLVNSNR